MYQIITTIKKAAENSAAFFMENLLRTLTFLQQQRH